MAKQTINIGATANDHTGTSLRAGGDMINDNFTEIYNTAGDSLKVKPVDNGGGVVDTEASIDLALGLTATEAGDGAMYAIRYTGPMEYYLVFVIAFAGRWFRFNNVNIVLKP